MPAPLFSVVQVKIFVPGRLGTKTLPIILTRMSISHTSTIKKTCFPPSPVCSWASCTQQVKCTFRTLVNGLPVLVGTLIIPYEGGMLNRWALGQDNPSTQCIVGDVPEIWDGTYLFRYLLFGFAKELYR